MAVTFLEAVSEQSENSMEGALTQMFDYYSPVYRDIPAVSIDGRWYDYEFVAQLPSVGWRAYNEAWTDSTGVLRAEREYMKILGGESKVDVQLMNTAPRGTRNLMETQVDLKVQAAANEFDRAFFEGSELNSPKEMVGLRPRIGGTQLILNAAGGGALTLAKLDSLLDAVPFSTREDIGMRRGEGTRKVLYMNRTVRAKIDTLINAATGPRQIQTTRDAFGDQVEMWRDAVIRVVEQTGDASTTLGYDEDPGDSVFDTASIYCVAFGENLVHGIYNGGSGNRNNVWLKISRFAELQSEPRAMTRFEGQVGLVIHHPRAAARLYAITNA